MNTQVNKPQPPIGISTVGSKRGGDYVYKGIFVPTKNIISPFLSSTIIYDADIPHDKRILL
jgi:hypothetical protein